MRKLHVAFTKVFECTTNPGNPTTFLACERNYRLFCRLLYEYGTF